MDSNTRSTTTVHDCEIHPDNNQSIKQCPNTVLDSSQFTLIWLDGHSSDENNNDIVQTKTALEKFTSNVLYFDNEKMCYEFITLSPIDKSLFIIVSGKDADNLLSKIHNLTKVDSVFVFCIRPQRYEYLPDKYFKTAVIVTDITHLLNAIEQSLELSKRHHVTFSLYEGRQPSNRNLTQNVSSFLWFKVFIDIIQSMPNTEQAKEEAKQEMLKRCKFYYRTNVPQLDNIKKFDKNYKSSDAIRWYTKNSFVYRLINKALRTEAFEECYTFRYFIFDLVNSLRSRHNDLIELQKSLEMPTKIEIYHGTKLTLADVEKLSVGCLISPNGFLSTSRSWQVAAEKYACIYSNSRDMSLESVIYEITVDVEDTNNGTILADISGFSKFPEELEILISLSATFFIDDIRLTENETAKFWTVKMTATSRGLKIKEAYMHRYTYQIGHMKNISTMIATLYNEMGQYQKAEVWLNLKREDTKHVIDQADHLFCMGFAKYGLLNYPEALNFFQEAYRRRTLPEYSLNSGNEPIFFLNHDNLLAYNLFCIGRVYERMQQYAIAKDYYDLSLQIYTRKLIDNHCEMATVMASLGRIELLQGNESNALGSFQNCLKLYNDDEHEKDSIFGYANVRIGQIHYESQKFKLALAYFRKALRFFDDFNPIEDYNLISHCLLNIEGDNPIARCHLGIGMCHLQQTSFNLANKHFFEALSVFQGQPDKKFFAVCYYNLGTSYGFSHRYYDSLDYYTKMFSIDSSISDKEKIVVVYNVYNAVGYYFRRRNYNGESLKHCEKAINILERLLPQYDVKRVGADFVFRIIRTKVSGNCLQRWLIEILLLFINMGSLITIFLRTIRRFMHV